MSKSNDNQIYILDNKTKTGKQKDKKNTTTYLITLTISNKSVVRADLGN